MERLVAQSAAEVPRVLTMVDQALDAGWYVAGGMTYEAGAPFVDAPSHSLETPVAWFGVYETFASLSAGQIHDALQHVDRTATVSQRQFAASRADYRTAIGRIHDLIRAGEVYQINYTAPLRFRWSGDPVALYRHGRRRQRVPYGALWNRGTDWILSWSPELFFHIDGRRIVTRPMKGTIRRGKTPTEDAALRQQLAADPKNRAENLMIVDLLRNDLSRCCETGSVRVPHLFATEAYETVTQMTSTVEGTLAANTSLSDVFAALFPCGSITGAPKRRAMQHIHTLEPTPRGVYCGTIGWAGPERATFNVAIRTARLMADGRGTMGVGSGIVWDSTADAEYDECQLKGQFLCTPQTISA